MAEDIINIASFSFDATRLEASMDSLQKKMFDLKKQQDALRTTYSQSQKEINELVKVNQLLINANQQESESYKQNIARIEELTVAQQKTFQEQKNLELQSARVRAEYSETTKVFQTMLGVQGEVLTVSDALNTALEREITSINAARQSNTEILKLRNQLNPAIAQEAKFIAELNSKLDSNNKFIKENVSGYEQQKIGIGDYAGGIRDAVKELGFLDKVSQATGISSDRAVVGFEYAKKVIGEVKNEYRNFRQAQEEVKEAQEAYRSAVQISTEATEKANQAQELATQIGFKYSQGKATQAEVEQATTAAITANVTATQAQATATAAATTVTNAASASLKLFRIALISTGIGAIVVLLGSLISYFATTQEGIDRVTSVTRPLQAIFQSLLGVFQRVGSVLADLFSNPTKAIKDFWQLIKENIVNRFVGLLDLIPQVGKAIGQLFEGDFSGAAETATNAVAKVVTGVDDITTKVGQASKATGEFFSNAIKNGQEYDKILKQLDRSEAAFIETVGNLSEELKAQNLIAEDTTKTTAQREAAARRTVAIARELRKLESERYDLQIKAKELENERNDTGNEELKELAELRKARNQANASALELETTQNNKVNSIRKEAYDKQVQRTKELQDKTIKAMETELATYIASQGTMKKSLDDQLKYEQTVRDKQTAIAKKQLDAGKLNQKEYELELLNIKNDFLGRQTQLVVENADLELEIFKNNNQRKIDENKFFSDELYYQEIDRIERVKLAEEQALKTRFEAGLLNQQEYNLALDEINQQAQETRDTAFAEREAAQKEKEALDLQTQRELQQASFDYDVQAQLAQYDRERALQREEIKKMGGDLIAYDKATAQGRIEIERTVQDNKLELASNAFSQIASILGEESAAGKAVAIAATTIDTYRAAQSAYTGMVAAIPGPVGIALGAVAAAASVVSGLANVKKIVAVKTPQVKKPSYARGVIGLDGAGTETSDSIPANLSRGESVINAVSTAMFPQLLSAINMAGGGDGISSNSVIQNNIQNSADSSQMVTAIAEAVAIGAEMGTAAGSQRGITNLSDNRQVMNNAKF